MFLSVLVSKKIQRFQKIESCYFNLCKNIWLFIRMKRNTVFIGMTRLIPKWIIWFLTNSYLTELFVFVWPPLQYRRLCKFDGSLIELTQVASAAPSLFCDLLLVLIIIVFLKLWTVFSQIFSIFNLGHLQTKLADLKLNPGCNS